MEDSGFYPVPVMAMKFDIFYRRPTPGLEKGHLSSGSDDGHSSQPPQLSFDKIIAGDTRSVRITV